MKILGIGHSLSKSYICEVTHTEIEQFLNQYYGKLPGLKVGDEVDLGKGYDFASDAQRAFKQTQDFVKAHQEIIKTIMEGIRVLPLIAAASDPVSPE